MSFAKIAIWAPSLNLPKGKGGSKRITGRAQLLKEHEMLRKHHLFMHPLPIIHPTIYHPQVHVFMNSSIHHPCICVSTHPLIRPSIIQVPIHPTIHPSIRPSSRCLFIQSSIHMSSMNPSFNHPIVDLANYAFIHHLSCPSAVDTVMCCPDPLAVKDLLPQLLAVLVLRSL